jgi:undecaprenyl-phosphate 4-deoxy-4-formamido-L-arabinose transferase
MNETPSVSIVVPVYNEAQNLDELIERCLRASRETPGRVELILIDDGSNDGSREIFSRAATLLLRGSGAPHDRRPLRTPR